MVIMMCQFATFFYKNRHISTKYFAKQDLHKYTTVIVHILVVVTVYTDHVVAKRLLKVKNGQKERWVI